jgi:hypothetical protein
MCVGSYPEHSADGNHGNVEHPIFCDQSWDLLPDQHLVDSGYVTIANLVQSQSDAHVDLVGPTLKTHWYQAETGYDLTHFSIDWQAETLTCPQGRISSSWTPVQDAGKSLIKVKFSKDVIVKSVPAGLLVQERHGAV